METVGWFGVNRDAKMIGYFNRLGLNKQIALTCLYFLINPETSSAKPPYYFHALRHMVNVSSTSHFLCFLTDPNPFRSRAQIIERQ